MSMMVVQQVEVTDVALFERVCQEEGLKIERNVKGALLDVSYTGPHLKNRNSFQLVGVGDKIEVRMDNDPGCSSIASIYGKGAGKLMQRYARAYTLNRCHARGGKIKSEKVQADGSIVLRVVGL